MNAKLIVRSMLEADEQPEDFIQRQGGETDGERVMLEPKFGYDFNIGEGNYRCGIAFTVKANSEEEALYVRHFWSGQMNKRTLNASRPRGRSNEANAIQA